jgi:RNA polymerase sigma-70 factor, ECF subfamily
MKAGPRLDASALNPDLTDANLVQLSAAGDEQAFLALYRRHQGTIFRYALHMSGTREIAEEVTQEVFLALLGGLRHYAAERGPLEAYLIGMARNQVRRYLAQAPIASGPAMRDSQSDRTEAELDEEQQLAALRAAILKLPSKYREVVVLCDLENFDYARAAAHLGCAVGTVRSRLHRARAILRTKLHAQVRCSV